MKDELFKRDDVKECSKCWFLLFPAFFAAGFALVINSAVNTQRNFEEAMMTHSLP